MPPKLFLYISNDSQHAHRGNIYQAASASLALLGTTQMVTEQPSARHAGQAIIFPPPAPRLSRHALLERITVRLLKRRALHAQPDTSVRTAPWRHLNPARLALTLPVAL